MGCTSSNADSPSELKIVKLQPEAVNQLIDQIPIYIIQKLKQKFNNYKNETGFLIQSQFLLMYNVYFQNNETKQVSVANNELLKRLFQFYTDKIASLTFKKFITKYAILTKAQNKTLSQVLYFLYSKSMNEKGPTIMTKQNYEDFISQERSYFAFQPSLTAKQFLSQEQFPQLLIQSGFYWQQYRKKFVLFDKDDIPFEQISRGLVEMDLCDLIVGQQYYLISSEWFERWSFYYQGADTTEDKNYKSTKLIKRRSSMMNSGKKRKPINRSSISKDQSFRESSWIIQRPTMITYQSIEGDFKGQLKQNIKASQQIRIFSKELWQMLKKTIPAEVEYRRTAISTQSLDLYPKSVYFLQTDKSGKIIDSTMKILQLSLKKKLKQISVIPVEQVSSRSKQIQKYYYFVRNFGENLWNQEKQDSALGMCSVQTRFYVVRTINKDNFIEKYFRKKKKVENLTYGDKVYSFFTFNKKVMPAYIIRFASEKTALIHYLDFSFRYEIQVDIESLSVEEEGLVQTAKKQTQKKVSDDNFSFKGIQNIGNTCFINSIIQCLIGSPILQQFFLKKKTNPSKQPVLHQICQIAVPLLSNKKCSPIKLKKIIDMHLQVFSGNDQHDAQEFLSFLLEKLISQIKEGESIQKSTENVFEHLFKGKMQTTLECMSCSTIKKNDQQISIVSLPIPQPQYNTYSIFIFPVYDINIKKIVLRLHKTSKVNDYLVGIQQRLGAYSKDYIFAEYQSKNFKLRHDLFESKTKKQLLTKLILPGTDMYCFERIRPSDYLDIIEENKKLFRANKFQYFDYQSETEQWVFGKFLEKSKRKIEILNTDNSFSVITERENRIDQTIRPLGQKTKQIVYKKIIMRKYNEALKKMESFGYYGVQFILAFPKEVTYLQLVRLAMIVMKNFTKETLTSSKKLPFYLKIFEANKQKCIFCNSAEQKKLEKDQYKKNCCKLTQQQLNTPIIWISRQKEYSIFIDWYEVEEFNNNYAHIDVDNLSLIAEKMKFSDKIQIQECLKKYQQAEDVEMQCDKCKHKHQRRAEVIKELPNLLVLHLKQYSLSYDMVLTKMDVNLKWLQYLDISKYSKSKKGSVYELYGYVRHHGTSQSGHYTCAIKRKHPFQNKRVWVNFDDELTTILENDQKNIDAAYLLFFKKVDMPNSGIVNFTF